MAKIIINCVMDVVSDSMRPVYDKPKIELSRSELNIRFQRDTVTLQQFDLKTIDSLIEGLIEFKRNVTAGVGLKVEEEW